jgi:hypothetical protein
MDRHSTRIAAYSALAVALLFLPAIAVGIAHPIPAPGTPANDLVAYLAAHRTPLLVAFSLSSLGWGGLRIVFGGGLWAILRRAEGGPHIRRSHAGVPLPSMLLIADPI